MKPAALFIADNGPTYALATTARTAAGEAQRKGWTAAAIRPTTAQQPELISTPFRLDEFEDDDHRRRVQESNQRAAYYLARHTTPNRTPRTTLAPA